MVIQRRRRFARFPAGLPAGCAHAYITAWDERLEIAAIVMPAVRRPLRQALDNRCYGCFQAGQIFHCSMPYRFQINAVILMAQPVTKTPNFLPWLPWTQQFGLRPEPERRLTNLLQIAFNCINRFNVVPKLIKIHTCNMAFDALD